MGFNWIIERFVFLNGTWRGRKMSEVKCEFLTSCSRLSIFSFELSSNANIIPEKCFFFWNENWSTIASKIWDEWFTHSIKLITHFDEISVKIFILSYIRVSRMIVSLSQNWIRFEMSTYSKALQMFLSLLEFSLKLNVEEKTPRRFLQATINSVHVINWLVE